MFLPVLGPLAEIISCFGQIHLLELFFRSRWGECFLYLSCSNCSIFIGAELLLLSPTFSVFIRLQAWLCFNLHVSCSLMFAIWSYHFKAGFPVLFIVIFLVCFLCHTLRFHIYKFKFSYISKVFKSLSSNLFIQKISSCVISSSFTCFLWLSLFLLCFITILIISF